MLIWLFPLIMSGEAGIGITGLSGGLDALYSVMPWCAIHQCSLAVLNCIVRCGPYRDRCGDEANGDSLKAMTMKCMLERSVGGNCVYPVDTFINKGKCSFSREDFQVKATGCKRAGTPTSVPDGAECCSGKSSHPLNKPNERKCLAEGEEIPKHPHFILEIQTFNRKTEGPNCPADRCTCPPETCTVWWEWRKVIRNNEPSSQGVLSADRFSGGKLSYSLTDGESGKGKYAYLIDQDMLEYFKKGNVVMLTFSLGKTNSSLNGNGLIGQSENIFQKGEMMDPSRIYAKTNNRENSQMTGRFTAKFKFYYEELQFT